MRRLVRVAKRTWLEDKDRISAVSFHHDLTQLEWRRRGEEGEPPHFIYKDSTKITLFFGRDLIVIHSNDFIPLIDSYEDFINKLKIIQKTIEDAIERLESKDKETYHFSIRRFLNDSDGPSSIYTSSIAITSSPTHGRTFEISSCDHKGRIYLGGRSPAIKFLTRLNKFIIFCVDEVEKTVTKYGQELRDHKDKIKL